MSFHVGSGVVGNDAATEPLERMVINGAGNVGIGTGVPATRLHVFHQDDATITITSQSGTVNNRNELRISSWKNNPYTEFYTQNNGTYNRGQLILHKNSNV
jgi:hypothetical protein